MEISREHAVNPQKIGNVCMTQSVFAAAEKNDEFSKFIVESMGRFLDADWGDAHEDSRARNEKTLLFLKGDNAGSKEGLFGVYPMPKALADAMVSYSEDKLWILTEDDMSATTILFPGDY